MLCPSLFGRLLAINISAVTHSAPWGPFSFRPERLYVSSSNRHRCCEIKFVLVRSHLEDGISQSFFLSLSSFFRSFFHNFPFTLKQVVWVSEFSTVPSQHLEQIGLYAFTSVHWKERLFWLMLSWLSVETLRFCFRVYQFSETTVLGTFLHYLGTRQILHGRLCALTECIVW